MEQVFYTAGELAKLTGVSYKTIRHYREKGLLEPEERTENGYRLYSRRSVERLQRILMLKYLNFSLEEIREMLQREEIQEPFLKQEKLLRAQMQHLEQVLSAVQKMQQTAREDRWEQMLHIIRMTQQKEEIIKQYTECENLQNRINIHAYSTAKTDWFQWVLDGLALKEGMRILEIGCGNGRLWSKMHGQLPRDLQLILTDSSEEMIKAAKRKLAIYEKEFQDKNIQISFMIKDAEAFHMEEGEFDRIIANHMLYHVSNENRPGLLETCAALLKDDGMFYASTIGNTHMQEIFELIRKIDSRIEAPGWMSAGFELENGRAQLEQVFSNVLMDTHENDLLVPDPQAIIDYIESLPGNAKEILQEKKEKCRKCLGEISEDHPYFIHKSTGAFRAYKSGSPV